MENKEHKDNKEKTSKKKIDKRVIIALGFLSSGIALFCALFFLFTNFEVSRKSETPLGLTNKDLDEIVKVPIEIPYKKDGNIYEDDKFLKKDQLDEFGTYDIDSRHHLKKYTSLNDINVSWHKGARLISKSEMNNLVTKAGGTNENWDQVFLTGIKENKDDDNVWKFICDDQEYTDYQNTCEFSLHEAGVVTSPKSLEGNKIYYMQSTEYGMGVSRQINKVLFVEKINKFIFLDEKPFYYGVAGNKGVFSAFDNGPDTDKLSEIFTGWYDFKFTETDFSIKKIYNSKIQDGYLLRLRDTEAGEIDQSEEVVKNRKHIVSFIDAILGNIYFDDYSFYKEYLDGHITEYQYIPNFIDNKKIEWTKKIDTTDEFHSSYQLGGSISTQGCGAGISTFDNIINDKKWFNIKNLVQVGQADGEPIYEFNEKERKTSSIYKDFKDLGLGGRVYNQDKNRDESLDYKENKKIDDDFYYNNTPIIFRKDFMGNWRIYLKTGYESMAECGKPVIYLYPEQETKINVQVEPNGGFTYVDPEYNEDGWTVLAQPNGDLFNYADQQTYPYLFWEGHSDGIDISDKGFVFKKDEVPTKMRALLHRTGLRGQEIEDFMEFWQDPMMIDEYVFVTFANQRNFEASAPLTVTPKPDYTLRVFMYYEPLSVFKQVEPLPINTKDRHGFSVIEWGGGSHHIDLVEIRKSFDE